MRNAKWAVFAVAVAAASVLSGCTAGASDTATETPMAVASTPPPSETASGDTGEQTLEFSPLIVSVLSPEVVPVTGADGRVYLAYELSVFNAAPRDATLTKIETLATGERGELGDVIATADGQQVAANTMVLGGGAEKTAEIPAGRTAVVVVRAAYAKEDAIPGAFTHRLSATFAAPGADAPRLASKYPDDVAQIGGAVTVSSETPLVIGPPLAGENWYANNALDSAELNAHSDVVIPAGGRITAAERYAIDFGIVDPDTMQTYRGDPDRNESYLAFDQPLLAVADATVVRVVSDLPDVAPGRLTEVAVVDDATGNQVVLDLGDGVYALYAHMKQGSALVQVGDTVTKGQEIGRLGNSGNTSEAHLHFQLQRGPVLSAENVPWVIDAFTLVGQVAADGSRIVPPEEPAERTDEVPVLYSVFTFPSAG